MAPEIFASTKNIFLFTFIDKTGYFGKLAVDVIKQKVYKIVL